MTQLIKIILFVLMLPLFLNAQGEYSSCPYGEYLDQGTGQCITGYPIPDTEPLLPTCAPGKSMKVQGVLSSCTFDTSVAPLGLFLADSCGASQRPVQGKIDPSSCIDMPNIPPTAYAGGSRVIIENTEDTSPVVLHGSGLDRDEDPLTYEWIFIQRPVGSNATLDNNTSSVASFEPDIPGIYLVQLVVNDGTYDSEPDIITIKINQRPIPLFSGPATNIWGQDFDLNASASFDPDGAISSYNWTPSYSTSAINTIPAPNLGMHQYVLSVTDDDGATSSEVKRNIETIMCAGQEDINLTDEVEGSLYINIPEDNSKSCYKIDLSSNNGTEKYAFYMNLLADTYSNSTYRVWVKIYDETGTRLHTFETKDMTTAGRNFKEQFEISESGAYYIEVYRGGGSKYNAKYAFSIHPSLENGLIQDHYGEINDFLTMATPLTLDDDNTLSDVKGDLNIIRTDNNSLKNTDDKDWYSLDIQTPGKYAFYMNLLAGTVSNSTYRVWVKIYDDRGIIFHTFDTASMTAAGRSFNEEFTIDWKGTYYIRIYRRKEEGTKQHDANYNFSIDPSI